MIKDIFIMFICIIVTMFPLLIYNMYLAEKTNMTNQENNLFFDISIFFSQFLLIETIFIFETKEYLIISIIPCIMALLKKRYIQTFLILSILLLSFTKSILYPLPFIIIFYLIFIIDFIVYLKTNISKRKYINIFYITEGILFLINYLISIINNPILSKDYILNIIYFFISIEFGCRILLKIEQTSKLQSVLKEVKKAKEFKNSMFKITHEIKNPIAVVNGYLSIFDTSNKEKSDRYIKIIKSEIKRVLNLLADILEIAKININKNIINTKDLFYETKEILIPLFEEKKINYRFNIEENISINIDYDRIKQVLLNIIKNAIEASFTKGTIIIDGYTSNKKYIICITDYGKGMSKETKEMLNTNTPFYTTKENGTGLGVCLSKEIIEAHGGKISFNSIQNKKTTFKIIIPIK